LHCVERVWHVEPLAKQVENARLPMLEVNGLGSWEKVLSISMPDAAMLEKIRERQKALAPIYGGAVSRGKVEAVAAPAAVLCAAKRGGR
jgi:uncharacterized protein YmfQ (DUF2313 family)